MQKKLSDGELMVYLRNAGLALSELAREHGVSIQVYASKTGYAHVCAGDYQHTKFYGGCEGRDYETYEYSPWGDTDEWRRDVDPNQIISLTQPPIELPGGQEHSGRKRR